MMWLHQFPEFVFAFIVLLLSTEVNCQECGRSRIDETRNDGHERVLGLGKVRAKEGSWPWMVAFKIPKGSGSWCSGFLIDRKHVLSSAVCFQDRRDELKSVLIGSVDLNEGEEYPVVRITTHPGYTPDLFYDDLAIVTLGREVNFKNFNPICLPDAKVSMEDLNEFGATVLGWGANRSGGKTSSFLQQLSEMPIISNRQCERDLRKRVPRFRQMFPYGINSGLMCVEFTEEGKGTCVGDTGGPLMYQKGNQWFAVGIVSFGVGCGLAGVPEGYTRISHYLDWIRENTRD